jgi:hypothetical protein
MTSLDEGGHLEHNAGGIMRSERAAHCPPLTRPHNQRYVQVPAAACDALRPRQGAADAALIEVVLNLMQGKLSF